ncbi:hypothetical protein [Amycolatopsis sp. lyj-112]|uniref:hypothetical protein n=1 Tax=Amycolatopsis sp. lyj-112 TaxID=2789288 RepID=UPI003977E5F7
MALGSETSSGMPAKQDVEQILNDPGVESELKRRLALQYIDHLRDDKPLNHDFPDVKSRQEYASHLKSLNDNWITEDDLNGNSGSAYSVLDAYKDAKAAYDKGQEANKQTDRKTLDEGAAKTQEIAGRATETDPGCANSNEILNPGLAAFKVYENFHPLYVQAVHLVGGGAVVSLEELRRLYHEQDNIPFDLFKASADELMAVSTAISGSAGDVSGKLKSSLGSWEGIAAEQAQTYQKAYADKTALVADAFKAASEGLLRVNGSLGRFCQDKVGWLQRWFTETVGEATVHHIAGLIRLAKGEGGPADIMLAIPILGFSTDEFIFSEEARNEIQKQAKSWLKEAFVPWFAEHIGNFQLVCQNTRDAINGAWKAYSDSLGQVAENPYGDLGETPETGGEKPVEKGGGEKDTGGSGPSTGGGGKMGGGGQMPPPSAVEYKQPEPPEMPGQEKNPVTDKPLDVDPVTGEPYPIDPRTGEAIKDATRPETMTVEQGDRKISLAEPGADGKMEISVQDGAGQAKDYDLDFGDGKAVPGTGEAAGGLVHRDTAERLDQQAASRPTAGQTYQPGPDGKIHIEDGGLKITAERPGGPEGPTLVTVDDGSGQPTKYTLGEDETAEDEEADVRQASPDAPAQAGGRHAAAADGSSESTSAQSLSDPFAGEDNGLGDASDPAGTGGGAATPAQPTGLGSAPGGGAQEPAAAGAGMMGGMGMMGGGGAGAGQGSGEDQQRTSSGYRVDGGLFDTATTGSRISGSLDDDGVIGFR